MKSVPETNGGRQREAYEHQGIRDKLLVEESRQGAKESTGLEFQKGPASK